MLKKFFFSSLFLLISSVASAQTGYVGSVTSVGNFGDGTGGFLVAFLTNKNDPTALRFYSYTGDIEEMNRYLRLLDLAYNNGNQVDFAYRKKINKLDIDYNLYTNTNL